MPDVLLLLLAGVGTGLCASVAGVGSLVAYPALLGIGLSPVAANVTSTVAMLANTVGNAASARPELRGQRRLVLRVCATSFVGGLVGAVLLLTTPAAAFEAVAPWLLALGSVLLLARDLLRRWAAGRSGPRPVRRRRVVWPATVVGIGVYGGYFGAGSGILLLAAMSLRYALPLPVVNAVRSLGTGSANVAGALVFVGGAPVDWTAALCLGAGTLVGGWLGPPLLRRLPETPLRIAVGLAGLGLSIHLAR